MALDDKNLLNNKLSPLIEGQVPDFVQSDHPVFVQFLKDYYKFLEAGELVISTNIDYVSLETSTSSYVIDETDSDRIVTELGAGTKGFFILNEIITGSSSGATATVLVDDSRNSRIFITSQQKFITGETITGGTSGSTGTIIKYRANPVQNIQQMLDYADVDNTIFDFLDKMRDSFMVDIPDDLASGISKRDLLKNIKDLYAAKGTSEGHKLFMRMLLGESADIFYPNQYMLKASAGDWNKKTVLRVLAFPNVDSQEVLNQEITGLTSGATATVVSTLISQQTKENFNDSVTEFEIDNIVGTFQDGEIVSGISTTNEREVKFTVFGILSNVNLTKGGTLYSKNEIVNLENVGNDLAEVVVDEITSGRVAGVLVDDEGINYAVGETITFTSNTVDTNIAAATAVIATVGGGILQETGTLDRSSKTDDCVVYESGTNQVESNFNILLEEIRQDIFYTDGTSTAYTLSNTNATNDTLVVTFNGRRFPATSTGAQRDTIITNWTASGSTLTFTQLPKVGVEIQVKPLEANHLLLDRTDTTGGVTGTGTNAVGGSDSGYKIESNSTILQKDEYDFYTRRKIVLEYDTFENLGVTSERGSIQHVRISRSGDENFGYTKLPTLSITTVGGTGAKLLAFSNDIGAVKSVKVNNNGFRYESSNPPDVSFKSHFLVKDVSGTFTAGNTLTSHSGTIKAWDSATNELVIENFDDTLKIAQEQTGTFNEGIQLEQGTELLTPVGFLLEDERAIPQTGFFTGDNVDLISTQIKQLPLAFADPFTISTEIASPAGLFFESLSNDEKIQLGIESLIIKTPVDVNEDRIVLDGTDIFDPYEGLHSSVNQNATSGLNSLFDVNSFSTDFNFGLTKTPRETIKVTAQYNEVSKSWFFLLDGKKQKNFVMYEGTEYYFDLSHPSLYGNESGNPIEKLQKSFAFSETLDGTHGSGTRVSYSEISITGPTISTTQNYGVGGAVDFIRIGLGNPDSKNWLPEPSLNDPTVYPLITEEPPQYFNSSVPDLPITIFDKPYYKDYSKLNYEPLSSFIPNFDKEALVVEEQFGTNQTFTADELYAIQKGYTGAYLKIKIPESREGFGVNNPNKLFYYSPNFDTMGGVITVKRKPKVVIGADQSLSYNSIDKIEVGFILENGSQDRTVGAEGLEATDKLIMEDAYDDVFGNPITEADLLATKPKPTLFNFFTGNTTSDADYLAAFFATNRVKNIDEYRNKLAQNYEPTYFMNEEYIPPQFFWGRMAIADPESGKYFDWQKTIPEPKNFTTPILREKTNQILSAESVVKCQPAFIPRLGFDPFPNFYFPKKSFNFNGNVLLDSFRENDGQFFLVLDGTDANGADAGGLVASEEFGNTLILDGTDTNSSNSREGFLLDDETGDGNILMDASSSEVDVADEIILEQSIDYHAGVTLTDSSGATGLIVFINKAQGNSTVSSTSTSVGAYRGINNLIGEDLIRLQDSYYYQDYSYEIVVGQSLLTYFDELKKAVHPAGFQPFGKVSIATLVSAAVTNTAAGVSDYTGDTQTFSPILGSVLETIFSQVLQSRLQVPSTVTADGQVPIGSRDDRIVQETGVLPGENLVLDASAASTDVGSNLLLEDGDGLDLELGLTTAGDGSFLYEISTITSGDEITNGTGDGGGRLMAETSHAPSGNSDRTLVTQRVTKLESRPLPRFERNILLYLAQSPFGDEPCGITLETGSGNLTDNIIMDGEVPFNEGNAFMELERDSEIDNIVLDSTDALGTNAGEGLILETGFFLKIEDPSLGRESETFTILFEDDGKLQLEASRYAFPTGYHVSEGNKLLLDTLDNDETIPLTDIGSLTFEQIRTVEKIEIQGLIPDEENWGGGADDDNVTMEDFGQILLDQTTNDGANAGFHLIQETSKRNRFTLEQSGTLIVEDFSTLSNVAALTLEDGIETGDIVLENILQQTLPFNIKLEDDDNLQGIIVLDGTDSSAVDAGDKLDLEEFFDEAPTDHKILLEEHRVFTNEGQIPAANFRLNSTKVITKGNVRSAEVSVRDTGDIALEDSTDDTHGYLVLNSTSGSSTNAGENFDLEGATGITY